MELPRQREGVPERRRPLRSGCKGAGCGRARDSGPSGVLLNEDDQGLFSFLFMFPEDTSLIQSDTRSLTVFENDCLNNNPASLILPVL